MKLLLPTILLFAPLMASATTFTATCSLDGFGTVSGSSGCVNDPYSAISDVSKQMPAAQVSATTSATDYSVSVMQKSLLKTSEATYPSYTSAQASIASRVSDSIFYFTTDGTSRAGYMSIAITNNTTQLALGSGKDTFTIGTAENSNFLTGSCAFGLTGGCFTTRSPNGLIPFQLGEGFTVDIDAVLSDYVGGQSYAMNSSNSVGSTLSFKFYEADGITQVTSRDPDPSVAPEPASVGFTFLAGLVLVGAKYARRLID